MFLDPHNSSPQTGTINPLGVRSPVLGNWKKIKAGINGPGIPLILIQPLMVDWFGVYLGAIIFRSLDLKLFGHKRA